MPQAISPAPSPDQLREQLPDVGRAAARLREEVSRRIVGLEETVEWFC